jgi:hypothetical protein
MIKEGCEAKMILGVLASQKCSIHGIIEEFRECDSAVDEVCRLDADVSICGNHN